MNEEQKNFVKDMLNSEGWRIFEALMKEQADNYRRLATQPPNQIEDKDRTWFSAMASGLDEAVQSLKNKVSQTMPLLPGKENTSKNIKKLTSEGYSRDQAVAIALDHAKKRGKKHKGRKSKSTY